MWKLSRIPSHCHPVPKESVVISFEANLAANHQRDENVARDGETRPSESEDENGAENDGMVAEFCCPVNIFTRCGNIRLLYSLFNSSLYGSKCRRNRGRGRGHQELYI